MKRITVFVTLLVVLAGLSAPLVAPQRLLAAEQGAVQRIQFVVAGLSCPFCAYGIEKRLRREIAGLDSLGLDLKTGTVTLHVRDGDSVSDAQLRAVVKKAGFSVLGDIKRSAAGDPARPAGGTSSA